MARSHVMTAKRRAALRKAQLASAAKRRGRHAVAVNNARYRRNKARKTAGFSNRRRRAINSRFEADVNASRVTNLGKSPRSAANQARRRKARVVGKHAVIAGSIGFQVASVHNPMLAAKVTNKAVHGTRIAAHSPHYAKGFAKGAKRGYSTRRARDAAARRNMRGVNFGHASSHRVSPAALGTKKTNVHGRRVRGY